MSTDTTSANVRMGKGPEDIVFFGSIDRKEKRQDGPIASSFPAWYMDQQVENLREQIESTERAIDRGYVPKDSIHESQMLLNERKKRLEEIEKSKPRLNAAQSQWLKKVASDLECNVKASLFSRDAMMFGEASAHDEMKRMTRGCVKIDPLLAKQCGCRVNDEGMVSRNEASRALKIVNKLIGKPTNMEYLRRSEVTCRTQRVEAFTGSVEDVVGRESNVEGSA